MLDLTSFDKENLILIQTMVTVILDVHNICKTLAYLLRLWNKIFKFAVLSHDGFVGISH